MSAIALEAQGLSYRYPDGTPGLAGLSLSIRENERVALLGANGAGKSTLLLLFAGILQGEGVVKAGGLPVMRPNLPAIRKRVGILFQDPDDQLFCPSILEDAAFGPLNLGSSREEADRAAREALRQAGIGPLADRPAHHLSLGERRRAALAAVLSMGPSILLMDEPTSNLDPRGRRELAGLLKGWAGTQVVATHNLGFAEQLCERAVVLKEGRVVFDGSLAGLLKDGEALEAWGLR